MPSHSAFWKSVPMLRLVLPFIVGIILQWYLPIPIWIIILLAVALIIFYFAFGKKIISLLIPASMVVLGVACVWVRDVKHTPNWVGDMHLPKGVFIITILDPPVERANTWSATARLNYYVENDSLKAVNGYLQVYFRKDAYNNNIKLQSQLAIEKELVPIENSRNPGSFDYKRYAHFQGIDHQVFLAAQDFVLIKQQAGTAFPRFINRIRERLITTLQLHIHSKKERGLAEALLIGYKQDLEQDLVQSYTNTGVAHIIAISGLHLGVIYLFLMWALKPLRRFKRLQWLTPVLVIIFLWLFSILAGAQPSVIRSAVMFSCFAFADVFSRRSNMINSMALSAGIMLLYNPYWLWDVGFQLSYAAVLSIVIFVNPIYDWIHIKNKVGDFMWKICAVTLAAQILTLPLTLYYFHQFPLHFIFTNIVAVPFSNVVLTILMLLSAIFFWLAGAEAIGWLAQKSIWLLNSYVEQVERHHYLLLDGISITKGQVACLYIAIAGFTLWLLKKDKQLLFAAMGSLLIFISIRSYSFIETYRQEKLVVYNISGIQAVDFINGYHYAFMGDSSLLQDGFKRNFHLKPARILYRLQHYGLQSNYVANAPYVNFFGKKMIVLDGSLSFAASTAKPVIDFLLVTGKRNYTLAHVLKSLQVKQVVLDGSVPQWKWPLFKHECDSLQVPCFYVKEQGPFIASFR